MPIRILLLIIAILNITTAAYGTGTRQNGVIIGEGVNFRAEPDSGGRIISVLKQGLTITILEQSDNWYMAQLPDGRTGWICQQFVKKEPLAPDTLMGRNSSALAVDKIIAYAKSLIGIKYVYGGQSIQGFDCSGFTMYVFAKFGINLPHLAELQLKEGEEVPDKSDLVPGDLVFFKTEGSAKVNHVGIYIGDGRFIHASSGYGSVRISPLDKGYYNQCYVGGRRLIEDNQINLDG